MPMIPKHDYSVSELYEQKLYAITYCYMPSMGEQADEWCADTMREIMLAILHTSNELRATPLSDGPKRHELEVELERLREELREAKGVA